jgi:GNAT superfamily N-acetyltransferase
MLYREATVEDIPQIQIVRNSVKENMLSDPALVPDHDVEDFIINRGKGWVCEIEGRIVGFSIADLRENNVWALFLHPDFEAKGIGKELHRLMMDWYFEQTTQKIWLGTAPDSRAETFYRMQGWKEAGMHGKNEIKFEMDSDTWSDASSDRASK